MEAKIEEVSDHGAQELERLMAQGGLFERGGRFAEANACYQAASNLRPSELGPRLALAKLLLAAGNAHAAVGALGCLDSLQPPSPEACVVLAQALLECGRSDEAEPQLQAAIALSEASPEAHAMLGQWLHSRGRFDEAERHFARAIEFDERLPVAWHGWTSCRRLTPADAASVERLERVFRQASGHDAMVLAYSLGKAREDLGEFEAAMTAFEQANRLAFQANLHGRAFDAAKTERTFELTKTRFDAVTLERRRKFGASGDRPVFVVGMIRSGTTLLEQMLASHPDIAGAGELPFWLQHADGLNRADGAFDVAAIGELGRRYLAMAGELAKGKRFLVDKMPFNYQVLGAIHMALPDARIVHIRRDPVATALSIWTTLFGVSPAFAHERGSIVAAFRLYESLMDHWRSVLPADRLFELRYEDLVASPEIELRRILSFLGLDWDDACLRHELSTRAVHTPSRWQARQPVYTHSIERRRNFEPWLGEFRALREIADSR